jgi:hypothetical protein
VEEDKMPRRNSIQAGDQAGQVAVVVVVTAARHHHWTVHQVDLEPNLAKILAFQELQIMVFLLLPKNLHISALVAAEQAALLLILVR